MTPAELTVLEGLEKAATPGEWTLGSYRGVGEDYDLSGPPEGIHRGQFGTKADPEFIAALRNAGPSLFAALRDAWEKIEFWKKLADERGKDVNALAADWKRVDDLCEAAGYKTNVSPFSDLVKTILADAAMVRAAVAAQREVDAERLEAKIAAIRALPEPVNDGHAFSACVSREAAVSVLTDMAAAIRKGE